MILNWKGDGVLTVAPYDVKEFKQFDSLSKRDREGAVREMSVPIDQVVIIPGWNEVADEVWFLCRDHLLNKIDAGMIEELVREEIVGDIDEDGKPVLDEKGAPKNKKVFVGATISDFKNRQGATYNPARLVEIIRGCGSIAVLEKWRSEDARDEIRAEIKNQIDKLNEREAPKKGE
jgi:hypothetical protein